MKNYKGILFNVEDKRTNKIFGCVGIVDSPFRLLCIDYETGEFIVEYSNEVCYVLDTTNVIESKVKI